MSRERFGSWGEEAPDPMFAAAVAVVGAVAASDPAVLGSTRLDAGEWWLRYLGRQPADSPLLWRNPIGIPGWDRVRAAEWADIYEEGRSLRDRFRYAVDLPLDGLDARWVVDILESRGAYADGVFFASDAPIASARVWRLPLRIGLVPAAGGVEIRRGLAAAADATPWVRTLIEPVTLSASVIGADVVVAEGDQAALITALSDQAELGADALIAFTEGAAPETLGELAGGHAVPVIGAVENRDIVDWLIEFTRELSHNEPPDVAFARASRSAGLLEAPIAFMAEQRLSRRANLVADALRAADTTPTRRADENSRFALAADFDDAARGAFAFETGTASDLVVMEVAAARLIDEASASRFLQAEITAVGDPDRPLPAFQADTDHTVAVQIGPPETGWLVAGDAFPEHELPAERPNVLTVILTEPNLLERPLVDQIVLPPTGHSTRCTFAVATRPDTETVDARIIVLSRNRVLQTARLPAGILVPDTGRTRGIQDLPGQVAEPETLVRGAGGNLGDRRTFDAAFVVNHGKDGVARATGIAGDQATIVDLDDTTITEAVDKLGGRLGEIVDAPDDFTDLTSDGSRELLAFLAHHGSVLRTALVKDFLGEALATATHLQIVSARPDAFFPFELAYDFAAPAEDARVCPDAEAALASPDVTDGCPGTHDRDTVCPFGFWGISKVIERHAYQPGGDVPTGFLVRSQPTRDRGVIELTPEAIVAASKRVDNFAAGSVQDLVDGVRAASGAVDQPTTWEAWRSGITTSNAALLVAVPHTVHSDVLDVFGLEIGSDDRVWAGDIDEGLLPATGNPVIVVLLGCETAVPGRVGYERFPGIFRRAGAEVVIGTLTEILGRHAAPVGGRIAQALYACCEEGPRGVGEVMVGLRRQLLAEGMMMVLAVAVFGDADWVLDRAS